MASIVLILVGGVIALASLSKYYKLYNQCLGELH